MRAVALGVPLVLLTACSGGSPDAAPESSPTPLAAVKAPASFTTWELGRISFATPPEFDVVPLEATSAGVEELALRAPSDGGEPAAAVLAVLTAEPTRPADQEVASLVQIKRDVQRARDVQRQEAALAGFSRALVVSYEQDEPDGSARRTSMLVADVEGGALLTVTVTAPADAYEDGALETVVRTASTG